MEAPSVLHIDTGRDFRGGQRQVHLLTKVLAQANLQQVIACPRSSELSRRVDSIPVLRLSDKALIRKLFFGNMRNTIREYNVNIIHAHDSEAHTLGLLLKRKLPDLKLLVTRRVIFPPSSGASVKYKYIQPVDGYIAISEAVAKSLIGIGVNPDRIDVIPSGIDLDIIESTSRNLDGFSEITNKYNHLIISVGAFTCEKDYETAIDAFALVREKLEGVALVIFGDGPSRTDIQNKISDMNLSGIYLMGYQEPLAPMLKVADLFLLTSRSEGLNSAAIEAAACGLPLVVSNVGGLPEIAENNINGLLCQPGNPREFANAMVRLLQDNDLHRQMSANSIQKSRQFDINHLGSNVIELYNRLIVY